jgi:hypothetical protein
MVALQVSIAVSELNARMGQRLRGKAPASVSAIIWDQKGQRVLLHLDSLQVRAVDGWLLCNLDLQTDPTGRQHLQFVFFIGQDDEGDSLQAAGTVNAPTMPATQLADRWGTDLLRVLWDAVLDGIEASLHHVKQQQPREQISLQGFTCTHDELHVQVLTGEL